MDDRYRGLRDMTGAAFFFSLMSLCVKVAGQRLPASELVFFRSVFGVVITIVMVRQAKVSMWGHRKSLLLLRGAVGFCGLVSYFYAVTKLPLGAVTVLFFTTPGFTALFAALLLKETMARGELIGLAMSFAGVVFVAQPEFIFGKSGQSLDPFAVAAVLTSAVMSGFAYTIVRKLRETDHHLTVMFYYPLLAVPLSIPLITNTAIWPTATEWLVIAALGIVTQAAHLLLTRALHADQAGRTLSLSYTQIVFAAVWGVVFFGEVPTMMGVFGALLVIGGTLLVATRVQSPPPMSTGGSSGA